MDPMRKKVKQWIDSGKDPRSAHWQAALESMLDIFSPYLAPGKLIPVVSLENGDIPVFSAILETADLSPNLTAAFLPPSIAGKIIPPESADELYRIDKEKPSYKILIARPGEETRILCAEISPHARKPGADIFQSGALLGSYDYHSYEDCIAGLTQTMHAHMWQKGRWGIDEYRRYTVNWFEKVMDLRIKTVRVDQNCSFLHSPTLIKGNTIDAVFTLIFDIFNNRFKDPDTRYKDAMSAIRQLKDDELRRTRLTEFAQGIMIDCLNLMRDFEFINFAAFSDKENDRFKNEFSRTLKKIIDI